jgi:hypothetical protein
VIPWRTAPQLRIEPGEVAAHSGWLPRRSRSEIVRRGSRRDCPTPPGGRHYFWIGGVVNGRPARHLVRQSPYADPARHVRVWAGVGAAGCGHSISRSRRDGIGGSAGDRLRSHRSTGAAHQPPGSWGVRREGQVNAPNRFFAYPELSAAEAIERPIGAYRRVCVRLAFPSGAHFDVTAINESRSNRNTIERAAALVNERIRENGQAPIP